MRKTSFGFLLLLLLGTCFYFYSCHNRDLRGWWKKSDDGRTFLVIEDPDGASANNPCTLDGQPWLYQVGERGEIAPGLHDIACPAKVGFSVKEGVEYHFDYWGP
jgi:hypothetical protein